jgi:hypothetical protein
MTSENECFAGIARRAGDNRSAGEPVWGEKINFCPDALYLKITGKKPEDVSPRCAIGPTMPQPTRETCSLRSLRSRAVQPER